MNLVLQEILQSGKVRSHSGEPFDLGLVHVPRQQGEFLQQLIFETKPKVSLEIGLAFGISALFISEAIRSVQGTRHIVIDPFQSDSFKNIGLNNLYNAGFEDLVEFHELPSSTVLPKLECAGTRIDFAFIDGAHSFEAVFVDMFYTDRILRVGGILAIDDTHFPAVLEALRHFLDSGRYSLVGTLTASSADQGPRWKKAIRIFIRSVCKYFPALKRILRLEFSDCNASLAIAPDVRCVALRKEREG